MNNLNPLYVLTEANINNYHNQTIGTFKYLFGGPLKLIGKKLRRLGYRLKYTSPSNLTGKTGSVYYISKDGTKLVRISDHWSSSNVGGVNTCGNIKDCFWRLRGKPGQITNTEYQAGIIDLTKLKEVRPIRNPPQIYVKGDGSYGTGYLRTTIWDQGPQEFERRRRFRSVLQPKNPVGHNVEYYPQKTKQIPFKDRVAEFKAKKRSESAYQDVLTIQGKIKELEKQLPFHASPTPEILALRKQLSIAQLRTNGLSEVQIARRLSSAETKRQSLKDAIKRAREEALKRQQQ